MLALCEVTVSQERGFGSNHLVFLKARPQHAMGRCELRILGYTRYNTRNISSSTARRRGGSTALDAMRRPKFDNTDSDTCERVEISRV